MSDRRDPRSFVASVLVLAGYSHATAEKLVQRALDTEAHELAERIRTHEWADCGPGDTNCPCDAADLIDPEVSA